MGMISLNDLNHADRADFVRVCGLLFEHSPWIAERTYARRPFASREALHAALVKTMRGATQQEQIRLIAAHPDLVGRLARQGKITRDSSSEQSSRGIDTTLSRRN